MALPALIAPIAIWGMITSLGSMAMRFFSDRILSLGLSVFAGTVLFLIMDMAVEAYLEEIRQGIASQTAMIVGMIGLIGLDEYINIILSGIVAGWTFVISNGVSAAIKQRRWANYRMERDKDMLFGKSDQVSDSKGTTTVLDSTKERTYSFDDYIT